MQLLSTQGDTISEIIDAASRNSLSALVTLVLLVWALAFFYFGKERTQKDGRLLSYRFVVFVLVFVGVVGVVLQVPSFTRATQRDGIEIARPPIHTPLPPEQPSPQGRAAMGNGSSIAAGDFTLRIERARKYSGLTDYSQACELYSEAFGLNLGELINTLFLIHGDGGSTGNFNVSFGAALKVVGKTMMWKEPETKPAVVECGQRVN